MDHRVQRSTTGALPRKTCSQPHAPTLTDSPQPIADLGRTRAANGRPSALCRCPPTNPDLGPASAPQAALVGAERLVPGAGGSGGPGLRVAGVPGVGRAAAPLPLGYPTLFPLPALARGARLGAAARGRAVVSDRPPPAPGPASGPVRNLGPSESHPRGGRRILRWKSSGPVPISSPGLSNLCCCNWGRLQRGGWERLGWDALCKDAGSPAF